MNTTYLSPMGILAALALLLLSAPVARGADCPDTTDETEQAAHKTPGSEPNTDWREVHSHAGS